MTMEREEHMTASSREKGDFWTKEESDQDRHKLSLVPSSSRRWSAYRNPRIVRVSRTFGGKDRHSKVCTVRGLRDRRIRLSVPTAVQLYELQDKLGVGQPSKVIDWLIEATKHEIDKLPPLQMPPGFSGFPLISPEIFGSSRSSLAQFFDTSSSAPTLLKQGLIHPLFSSKNAELNENDDNLGVDEDTASRSKFWDMNDDLTRVKGKEIDSSWEFHPEKHKFVETYVPARVNFPPIPILSSHTLSFTHQVGNQFGFASHTDHQNPFIGDSSSIAASLSLSTNVHHNLSYFSPSNATPVMPHMFTPYHNAVSHPQLLENNFQLISSGFTPSLHLIGSSARPTLGEYLKLYHSESNPDNPPSI